MLKRVFPYFITILIVLSGALQLKGQEVGTDSTFEQYFYPNGQVSSEGVMRNSKPDGNWKTYYVTGVVKSEGIRSNFLLDSIWNFYNQAGEMNLQISYKIGEKSGYSIKYAYNNPENPGQSTLISKELYVMGKKEGNSSYYHPTGELMKVVYYKDGKMQGLSREYSRCFEKSFRAAIIGLVTKKTFFLSSGNF